MTERHEALTQTVEMLAIFVRETTDSVKRLSMIVELHERRLDDMEK